MIVKQTVRIALFVPAILLAATAMNACGKKSSKKVDSLLVGKSEVVDSIEIGKEFSVEGTLSKSDDEGYGLERTFKLEVEAESNLALEHAILSSCENDGEATTVYLMESSDGAIKIASMEFEGYSHVAESQFPGLVTAKSYLFTVLFIADMPCQILGATFKIQSSGQPLTVPDPAPFPSPDTDPTVQPAPGPNPSPTPTPDPTSSDLLGTWKHEVAGVYSVVQRFDNSHVGNERFVYDGSVLYDLDYSYNLDTSKTLHELVLIVTKINQKDSDVEVNVGDKNYCIFQLVSASTMKLECDEAMPTEFSPDAQDYQRQ